MAVSITVDERSLEKVLKDLERNLSKKEMRKLVNSGSKAGAMVMKRAIKSSAASMGVSTSSARVIKIRQLRTSRSGEVNGHHIFIGRGAQSRGSFDKNIGKGPQKAGFEIPVVWIEFGTFNHRKWSTTEPYTPATMKRHPNAMIKNKGVPLSVGIAARPFIRTAYQSSIGAATSAMFDKISEGAKKFKVSS